MTSDTPRAPNQLGWRLWLDNITRDLLDGGTVKRYIDEQSIIGLTSNPRISTTPSRTVPATTRKSADSWIMAP